MENKLFKVTVFSDTWEIQNTHTKEVVLAGPLPYNPSNNFDKFLRQVHSCSSIKEVEALYKEYQRWEE